MIPVYLRVAAYLIALGLFSLLLFMLNRRGPRRTVLERQRQIAERAHLDTYRPHFDDRFWDDWARRHGGGL